MSELKVYHCNEWHNEYTNFYLKHEADTIITELKNEIKRKEAVGQRWFERCMEERTENVRLKRALWLKRMDDAKHLVTAYENYDYFDCSLITIRQESARTWMTCKLRTPAEWVKIWKDVERKCRAKAEEYK